MGWPSHKQILNPNIEIRNNLKIQMTQIQNKLNINERLDLLTLKALWLPPSHKAMADKYRYAI